MKRKLTIEIDCGDDHCYDESGQCRQIAACDIGDCAARRWVCSLFTAGDGSPVQLRDNDGGVKGRLMRCQKCLDAERDALPGIVEVLP